MGISKRRCYRNISFNSRAGRMLQVFLKTVHMFCLGGRIGVMHSIVIEIIPPKRQIQNKNPNEHRNMNPTYYLYENPTWAQMKGAENHSEKKQHMWRWLPKWMSDASFGPSIWDVSHWYWRLSIEFQTNCCEGWSCRRIHFNMNNHILENDFWLPC